MTAWNASAEMMHKIRASIIPVVTIESLKAVLSQDFPRDCSALPISGGWGYTQADAVKFIRTRLWSPERPDFVGLEYHIVQKIIYEELIIFRPENYRFSGIDIQLKCQKLIQSLNLKYDVLSFTVQC